MVFARCPSQIVLVLPTAPNQLLLLLQSDAIAPPPGQHVELQDERPGFIQTILGFCSLNPNLDQIYTLFPLD